MSALGRGRSAFLQLDEDIEGAIIRFQDSVSFPVLTDLTLEWENGQAWDIYPTRLPDLYYGQPLEICGRFGAGKSGPVRLTVRGLRAGEARHAGKPGMLIKRCFCVLLCLNPPARMRPLNAFGRGHG